MIANKMESSGCPGKVMISESTKNWINNNKYQKYGIEFAKNVEIKIKDEGVDVIKAYYINKAN